MVFNGKQLFSDSSPVVDVRTDACYEGMGAFFVGDWTYVHFASTLPGVKDLHITHKETPAFVLEHWAPNWSNKHVIIHCDSQSAVGIINKGSIPVASIMQYLRRLFWLSAIFNFRITAPYIPGHDNLIANAISCLHDPYYVGLAFLYFCHYMPAAFVYTQILVHHMPYASTCAAFLLLRYVGF